MSANSDFLEKHGWQRLSRKKMGMVIIERWHDDKTGEIYSQSVALEIQRRRNAAKRLAKQPEPWINAVGSHT
jgi:hypothetical protein